MHVSNEMLKTLRSLPLSHRHGQRAGSCCHQCSLTAAICHTLHCTPRQHRTLHLYGRAPPRRPSAAFTMDVPNLNVSHLCQSKLTGVRKVHFISWRSTSVSTRWRSCQTKYAPIGGKMIQKHKQKTTTTSLVWCV